MAFLYRERMGLACGRGNLDIFWMRYMILKKVRNQIRRMINRFSPEIGYFKYVQHTGQQASDIIREKLLNDDPAMICRFGSNELDCLCHYLDHMRPKKWGRNLGVGRGSLLEIVWDDIILRNMHLNAGVFPPTPEILARFSQRMMEDVKQIDVLGSWMKKEKKVFPYMRDPALVMLHDLEPFRHASPWSAALRGKRVLVVHPFEKSIRSQYARHSKIFANKEILPDFELVTLKAVQSIAGEKPDFDTWFEALAFMEKRISSMRFDIALIGCGAYGLPLAAHVKRMGKKAVHVGGALQLMFGIIGARWDNPAFSGMFNEYWVHPLEDERPRDSSSIEGGCYW